VGIHFVALDTLDGPRADFAAFRQPLLRQAFLLPQFRYFESEVGLVHGLLLSIFIPHSRNHAQTFNVVYTTFLSDRDIPGLPQLLRPISFSCTPKRRKGLITPNKYLL
jgi:hypothetical protein